MPQNHENTKTLKKKFEQLPEKLEIICFISLVGFRVFVANNNEY